MMAHHLLKHSIVTFLAARTIRIKAIQLFKINPLVFSLLLSCYEPLQAALTDENLCIFFLSVYQKVCFKEPLNEATIEIYCFYCCLLLSWYSFMHNLCVKLHKCMNISRFNLNSPDVYPLSFQVQEGSVTDADGIMETSQPISSMITGDHFSLFFFSCFFVSLSCFCLSWIMRHLQFGRAKIFPQFCQGFSENINKFAWNNKVLLSQL